MQLRTKLSTSVDGIMWIDVNNWCGGGLADFCVDNPKIKPKVIHRLSTGQSVSESGFTQAQKKMLDRLSPYPQSLLLNLNFKSFILIGLELWIH